MKSKDLRLLSLLIILNILLVQLSCSTPKDDDLITDMPKDYPYDTKINKMYSGYLSIDNKPSKKLHYLYVESQNDPAHDPLVLWFNGGPGCSSLLGFADENGPVYFEENSKEMVTNKQSWNKIANIIYIEQPAGVGFSTVEKEEDYKTDDKITGEENLSALVNWFNRFPEFKGRDFYISGESYAGIYIPYLAFNILEYNLQAVDPINLKGILVGNGVTDWSVDTEPALLDFAYHHALYSDEYREVYERDCINGNKDSITCLLVKTKILKLLDGVNIYDIYRKCYLPPKPSQNYLEEDDSQQTLGYNYTPWLNKNLFSKNIKNEGFLTPILKDTPPCADGTGDLWFFNREDVKKALHVSNSIKFELCNDKFQVTYDVGKKGSIHLYERLIKDKIKIWHYSGDTDGAVPFNGTRKWIHSLNRELLKSNRRWRVNGEKEKVAGYVEEFDGITFVTVMGTGHMVPQWKREEAFHLFKSYITNTDI